MSSQRPSAVDMTTIYPTAVDHYHQPSVHNSHSDSPAVAVVAVAKEITSSPVVSSSPARLVDQEQVRLHMLPPTTTTTSTNITTAVTTAVTTNSSSNDTVIMTDEHTLREALVAYQRQAQQDMASIQALKQERDELLLAAAVSDVQMRGAPSMFMSPAGTRTSSSLSSSIRRPDSRSHSNTTIPTANTAPSTTDPMNTPLTGSITAIQYDRPPMQTIQKVLNASATATTINTTAASNHSYVQRIHELEEKLRFEAEQTAVILSQRDTFAMSKSALTAKLGGINKY